VIFVNPSMAQLIGKPVGELLGLPIMALGSPGDAGEGNAVLEGLAAGKECCLSVSMGKASEAGLTLRLVPLAARDGGPEYVAGFAELAKSPANPLAAARSAGERPMATDRVTGLPTAESISAVIEEACQGSNGASASIILFEIQAFDAYRNTFGPQAGDSTLRLVSRAIAGSLRRASDRVGRMDKARLIAVVERLGDEDASSLAQRICARVRELCIHHPHSPVSRYVTVAAGVAHVEAGDTVAQVLQRASQELSAAAGAEST